MKNTFLGEARAREMIKMRKCSWLIDYKPLTLFHDKDVNTFALNGYSRLQQLLGQLDCCIFMVY